MSCQRVSRLSSLLQSISHNATATTAAARTHAFRFARTTPASFKPRSSFRTSTPNMAQKNLDSQTISEITHKENELTGQPEPIQGGPTAEAQKHANQKLSAQRVSDIAKGEEAITGQGGPVVGGPAAFAQSEAANARNATLNGKQTHTGKLDSESISRINQAEKEFTGQPHSVKGGPTAQAQKHAGEPINSQNLHDITEGEKLVTGADAAVKGGPTATAQSELGKSRVS